MAAELLQQLPQLEDVCQRLYTAQAPQERAAAEQMLRIFGQSTDYISHCKTILDNSRSSYAQLLAASSLLKVVTEQSLSTPMKLEMRDYFLAYLDERGPGLEQYVTSAMVQLLCRMTKLCWFDDDRFKGIVDDSKRLLEKGSQGSTQHFWLGLKILTMLVAEFNQPTPGRTLTVHRKVAVAFRDPALFRVFELALLANQQLQADSGAERRLREQAMTLALSCLSYDFIGTCLDESSEDLATIQVPSLWRPVVEDPATLQLFLTTYTSCQPPLSSQALECLVRLASVRRSLFATEQTRSAFLNHLVTGTRDILRAQTGLQEHANYHEFCRLLGRLKTNYQLNELVNVDNYQEWIRLVAEYTVQSLKAWQWASGSIHYLLGLWSRLVSSAAYLKGDAPSLLDTFAPKIIEAYVSSRLESVQLCMASSGIEDPLDNEEQLGDQMEALPYMCRLQYTSTQDYLCGLADPLISALQERAASGALASSTAAGEVQLIEGRLSWLVHIIGAIIQGRMSSNLGESQETIDGNLAARAFGLMQVLDSPAMQGRRGERSRQRLDLALLSFLQNFRKVYIGEHVMHASKVYVKLAERLGIKDHTMVLNLIVNKVAANLRIYGSCDDIIQASLNLFQDLAAGFMSGKLMLKLDAVHFMLANHTQEHFDFLDKPANGQHRTTFYCTLARLLFMDDSPQRFRSFVAPLQQALQSAAAGGQSAQQLRNSAAAQTVVGLLRDLRGIAQATSSRRTYGLLFDWLYPAHFPLLLRCLEAWADEPAVTTALLKLFAELVLNRSQRLVFDSSSPNGILLFREVSKVLVTYGTRVLALPQPQDPYGVKYKGIWICLLILARALGGTYVNFGVFELYGDPALRDALDIAVRMCLAIPLADIMAYRKVARAFFALVDQLCHNHVGNLATMDTPTFAFLLGALDAGLRSLEVSISSQCASALDNLAGFYFKHFVAAEDGPSTAGQAMAVHMRQRPELLPGVLATLFEIVLFEDCSNQWSLSRPMLSIILANEGAYTQLRERIITSQPAAVQGQQSACLDALMRDVGRNLEAKNRDKFTQNLTNVRQDFRRKQS